ncbi:MAG: 16S rRNA (guanine(966)-N(2))-methyltransferase RsmD [Oscillospiraceae bacterium]|jgi:16S rRNA (guanine(966)-N(2))-methyltransferase RsmD|nr:16S rRNA (guanine(966)-N(2))-methyltransferase RsmD [Oscillospiraceae bacterium]MCI1991023.1 16S rRNA (guanine(966)-N(2))-methyltransferase RsmD [Oscillospiraceae bacterium]MCI2035642.1 16S rRNA (guanine(966)-N(2))-methyltransferase RsmD [Oscillospiraceae bacterium]
MRVITGTARGKRLVTREGGAVRPTPERVKEALFSIIQFGIEGRRILDLFAGSGQLGIEALSRGAKEAVFVDSSKESASVVQKNLESCGFEDSSRVETMDFALYLARGGEPFDLAFLDPPYRTGLLQRALPLVAARMNPGGTIICENPSDEATPETAGNFGCVRTYRYGKIILTLYRRKDGTTA